MLGFLLVKRVSGGKINAMELGTKVSDGEGRYENLECFIDEDVLRRDVYEFSRIACLHLIVKTKGTEEMSSFFLIEGILPVSQSSQVVLVE